MAATRPPAYREVPAIRPSTRNVGTERGIVVATTRGR
jgi:hypothetical protein